MEGSPEIDKSTEQMNPFGGFDDNNRGTSNNRGIGSNRGIDAQIWSIEKSLICINGDCKQRTCINGVCTTETKQIN